MQYYWPLWKWFNGNEIFLTLLINMRGKFDISTRYKYNYTDKPYFFIKCFQISYLCKHENCVYWSLDI